jgi:hypothetical protein
MEESGREFNALSQYLTGGTEKKTENSSQDIRFPAEI